MTLEEAQFAFADPRRITYKDAEHSGQEQRYLCLGRIKGGVLTVRFTYRCDVLRTIGAGYWRKGRRLYEQEQRD